MSQKVRTTEDGYAILRAVPINDSNLILTDKCPFCFKMHTHINPKKDERGDIPLRKSHCADKTITRLNESGYVVGNHIYYLEVIEDDNRT